MNIAVITGASSGLGKFYVEAVAKESYDEIWIIARRKEILEQIAKDNKKIKVLALDLTKESDLEAYKNKLQNASANVKLLVNNAGFGKLGDFDAMAQGDCGGMVDLNCKALTLMTNITLAFMQEKSEIINICSIAAFAPNPRMAVYSSTKAYVFSFSKALREELKSKKINVMAVCPGPMDTEFLSLANIEPGSSKTFDTLPRVSPKRIAYKSLKKSKKGNAVYTESPFYKLYRILGKLLPHNLVMKMSKT